ERVGRILLGGRESVRRRSAPERAGGTGKKSARSPPPSTADTSPAATPVFPGWRVGGEREEPAPRGLPGRSAIRSLPSEETHPGERDVAHRWECRSPGMSPERVRRGARPPGPVQDQTRP